jgi:hypothetical protein
MDCYAVAAHLLLRYAVALVMATSLPINGIATGDISDQFPVLFTPAGYVFSIWGVIYLLLLGWGKPDHSC